MDIVTTSIRQVSSSRIDSLKRKPHDEYPEEGLIQPPYSNLPLKSPFSVSTTTTIYPNVDLSADTFPQNEPSVKISRKNPNIAVAAWRDFRTGVTPAVRRIGYSYTTNGGDSWSVSTLVDTFSSQYPRSSDPAVGVDTAGNFYIATISITSSDGGGRIVVFKSTDQGHTFSSGAFAPGESGAYFEDKEYITSDLNPASPFANNLYISWTRFFGQNVAMMFTRSTDGGGSWSQSVQTSDFNHEGQGSVPAVGPDGEVYVAWETPTVYFDKTTDGGLTFGTDISTGLNAAVGFPSIAVDLSNGPRHGYIYVVAADARYGDQDVLLTYSSNGGTTWSTPARVNDDPIGNGKVQYWPWMAVDDSGNIHIVYLDTRNTPMNTVTETYLARSGDGGQTFTNILLSSQQSLHSTPNNDVRYGDYIGMDAWHGKTVPVWTDERTGNYNMEIYTSSIPDFDYNPLSLLSPVNGAQIAPGSVISSLSAKFQNIGSLAPTDSFDVKYRILFGNAEAYTSVKRIPGMGFAETRQVTFDGSFTPSDTGMYTIQAIVMAGDVRPDNDTLSGILHATYPLSVNVSVNERWNIVSSPVVRPDMSVHSLFPTAINSTTNRYYNSQYQSVDSLQPGRGYWMKFPSATMQNIAGTGIDSLTISVTKGWNLVGGIDHTIPAPIGGIVQSSVYGFNNGYFIVSSLQPGKGYWLKAEADGTLRLGPGAVPKETAENFESYARLSLTDNAGQRQTLLIAAAPNEQRNLSKYELPPSPPAGIFDVRFESQQILEIPVQGKVNELPLRLSGITLPLRIDWLPTGIPMEASIDIDGKETSLNPAHHINLTSMPARIVLKISCRTFLPTEFALHQNYPNPFNPATRLKFDIPQASDVNLKIYNLLGQAVATLVNEKKQAGTYTIVWDASTMPSGMYFYKLTAGTFTQTRKMILLK